MSTSLSHTELIEKTISALEKNKMKGYFAKSREELYAIIAELVKDSKSVMHGGSMTLNETGVKTYLSEAFPDTFRCQCQVKEGEIESYYRDCFSADTFLTSTNAVTEDGKLYNVDGRGNRVSAMIFGPKQVIVVCGVNKIVPDIAAAEERNRTISAPRNAKRFNCKTPCVKTGVCGDCKGDDRICCAFVTLAQQREKNRIKVIFLDEELGF